MTVLPVIERELRTQARLGFTYMLRVIGAATLLLFCIYFSVVIGLAPRAGIPLFGFLNVVILISIWVLVPLSCSDCISRERREGTLGLLFLTPLKSREIVLSKGLAHGLRALTLWLAAMPILTLCFLLGSVTWNEAVLSGLINFSSICWALAAGLLASSSTKSWLRAMLLAGALAACFFFGFVLVVGFAILFASKRFWMPWKPQLLDVGLSGLAQLMGLSGGYLTPMLFRVYAPKALLIADILIVLFSVLFLFAVILLAARFVRRSWQEEPPSARRVWVEQAFTQPIIGVKFFHRWLRRKLEQNPIGWLEQRTWSGRLVTWGWFAVMVSFYSAVFYVPNADRLLRGLQNFMAWSLLLLMAVSAAGSFQRERETRVLELLLISPMTSAQIIWGRLRGLWGQFLPALLLMVVVWLYMGRFVVGADYFKLVPFFCSGFMAMPVIGLYYSLKRVNFISAFLSTVAVGLLLPQFLMPLLGAVAQLVFLGIGLPGLLSAIGSSDPSALGQVIYDVVQFLFGPNFRVSVQTVIAIRLGWKLHYDLVDRNFPFSKGAL